MADSCFLVGQTSAFFVPFKHKMWSIHHSLILPFAPRGKVICRAQASFPRCAAPPKNAKTIGGLLFLGWAGIRFSCARFHLPLRQDAITSPSDFRVSRLRKCRTRANEFTEERSDPPNANKRADPCFLVGQGPAFFVPRFRSSIFALCVKQKVVERKRAYRGGVAAPSEA